VPYVRSERYEQEDSQPLRYVGLRLCAPVEAIRRMQKVWEVFALTTHATASKALGRASP
jgi:hypothetical protein